MNETYSAQPAQPTPPTLDTAYLANPVTASSQSQTPYMASAPSPSSGLANLFLKYRTFSFILIIAVILGVIWFLGQQLGQNSKRAITLVSTVRKEVPAATASLVIQQSSKNVDKLQAIELGKRNFEELVIKLQSIEGVTINEVPSQVVGGTATVFGQTPEYQFIKTTQIKVSDISQVPVVIAEIDNTNALLLQTVYQPEDENKVREDLISEAMDKAREDAKLLARHSGGRLGKVLSVVDTTDSQNSSLVSNTTQAQTSPSVELSKSLSVTFELQ